MKIEQGKIYSCGKIMHRKVIRYKGNSVYYAKCHFINGKLYVIGNETHFLHNVLISTLERWAKTEVLPQAIEPNESPSHKVTEAEAFGNDCPNNSCS